MTADTLSTEDVTEDTHTPLLDALNPDDVPPCGATRDWKPCGRPSVARVRCWCVPCGTECRGFWCQQCWDNAKARPVFVRCPACDEPAQWEII